MFVSLFALTAEDLKKAPVNVSKVNGELITFVDDEGNEFTVKRHIQDNEYVYIVL